MTSETNRIGDQATLTPETLLALASRFEEAARGSTPHEAGVKVLAQAFVKHFPVLCEVIAETIREGGAQRLKYWCDVAEMSHYANYHYVLE